MFAKYERVLNDIWPERNVYNHIFIVKGQGKPIHIDAIVHLCIFYEYEYLGSNILGRKMGELQYD